MFYLSLHIWEVNSTVKKSINCISRLFVFSKCSTLPTLWVFALSMCLQEREGKGEQLFFSINIYMKQAARKSCISSPSTQKQPTVFSDQIANFWQVILIQQQQQQHNPCEYVCRKQNNFRLQKNCQARYIHIYLPQQVCLVCLFENPFKAQKTLENKLIFLFLLPSCIYARILAERPENINVDVILSRTVK